MFEREPTRAERVADSIAVAACALFALVACWESAGPLPGGHFGSSSGFTIAGENILRWHKFATIPNYHLVPPTPDSYYCHHPYGPALLGALASFVFGHHWFTVRAPAIFCSALSAPILYALGRAMWGVVPAAFATLVFVFIPVDLAFNSFSNLEVPTIFFGLVFSWGTVRLWQTWKARWVVVAAVGAIGATQADWVGLVFIGIVVGFGFLRAYVAPHHWYRRVDDRLFAMWFGYATAAAVGSFLLYLVLFTKADHLNDLIASYHIRAAGTETTTWSDVFTQRRKMWIHWMVTPIGIRMLACAFPLSMVRLLRRPAEIIPIAWTCAATFQYFAFKEGADVHIFWPHYYGPAAALAGGVLADTVLWAREGLVRRFPGATLTSKALVAVLLIAPVAHLARMAFPQLAMSRKTGGRFEHAGHHIETDADVAQFLEWVGHDVPAEGALDLHEITFASVGEYSAHRPGKDDRAPLASASAKDPNHITVADTRLLAPGELSTIAKRFSVEAVGPYWRIDRGLGSSFRAIRYVERQPSALEWMFVTGTDLVRTIGPDEDAFATWEWRDALGMDTNTPSAAPGTFEELRVAHNVAVARGDAAKAATLRARLLAKARGPTHYDFTDDVHLLDVEVDSGSAKAVTLLWEAGPSFKPVETFFDVTCKVVAPPPMWWNDVDYFEQDMTQTPAIRPQMWKPGYLYSQRFVVLHRIGKEACRGAFTKDDPRPTSGTQNISLFTLD